MTSMCCLTDLHETHHSDQDRDKEEIKLVNVNVWIEFVVWRGVRREKIAGGKKVLIMLNGLFNPEKAQLSSNIFSRS